jgi:TRAP-type C4-dicarboxylate transport system permease small subunit
MQKCFKDISPILENVILMFPPEQLRREKIRAIAVAIIELVLGSLMAYIGFQLFNISEVWRIITEEVTQSPYTPEHIIGLYNAILMVIIVGGIFSLIHGIKRMVDNVLNAWVKSATTKPSEEKT